MSVSLFAAQDFKTCEVLESTIGRLCCIIVNILDVIILEKKKSILFVSDRLEKMLGGELKNRFFRFQQKICRIKKSFLNKKILYFNFGHFENKSCLIFLILQTLGTKNRFLGSFFPPHTIFKTKYLRGIPTVQIFYINHKDLKCILRN